MGHYVDTKGRYILKIGTTNDLKRRAYEHTKRYHETKEFRLPASSAFEYDWFIKLSKYNTLRYEDKNRALWQEMGIGRFIRNDRFYCETPPTEIKVTIKKTYIVKLTGV